MSSIDPSAAQTALFEKLGISNNTDVKKASSGSLGQSDFLKLMTTQLQNQDPFAPMDNGDFIAQMAQFSTVTGIPRSILLFRNLSISLIKGELLLLQTYLDTQYWFLGVYQGLTKMVNYTVCLTYLRRLAWLRLSSAMLTVEKNLM